MSGYSKARDQRVAEEVHVDRSTLCRAHGCPNRWSIDGGNGKCCSAHAWAELHHWPAITQEQLDAETERALRNAAPPAPPPRVDVRAARAAIRQALPTIGRAQQGKQWAERLRDRERRGERLTPAQKAMWRAALNVHGSGLDLMPDVDPDALANARSLGTT